MSTYRPKGSPIMKLTFALAALLPSLSSATPSVWPLPASLKSGSSQLVLPNKFALVGTTTEVVAAAFERYESIFFPHDADFSGAATVVSVSVANPSAELQLETDESYTLSVPDDNSPISITAATQLGLYHAVETLSQLISFDFDTETYKIHEAPIDITDGKSPACPSLPCPALLSPLRRV